MSDFSLESFVLAFKEANITKAELARRMGVSPQAVQDYFKHKPSMETWSKFYQAIGKTALTPYASAFDNLETATQVKEDETRYQPSHPQDLVSKLKELSNLYKADLLTQEEFAEAKAIVIKKFKNA